MKKFVSVLCLCIISVYVAGYDFKSSLLPEKVKISYQLDKLVSKAGEPERYQKIEPEKLSLEQKQSIKQIATDAVELSFTIKNNSKEAVFLRPFVTVDIPFAESSWWNGYLNINKLKFDPADNNLSTWFPANAVHDDQSALIIGINPMKIYSRVDSDKIVKDEKGQLYLALPVYLEPGKVFDYSFVVASTPARYGYHDVIQKWYDLFPAAFKPAPGINPDMISGEASYLYWKPEVVKYKFVGDLLRRIYGGRGSWEWCYKPFIRGGDWAISDKWSVGWQGWTKEKVQQHRENIRRRLTPAKFLNVAPMWYLNVSWTEWSLWQEHFKGIELAFDGKKRRCWSQETIYGIYPWGSSYGELFMEGLKNIPVNFPESKGIAWDSCFAHKQIPQEHIGFAQTEPKSYYNGKPFAIEAAGISQLLNYNRQQFSGENQMANAVNFKLVSPYSIGVRTDAGLYEGHPMHTVDRLLRIESMRTRLGTQKALIWHKACAPEHMRWIDWEDMDQSEIIDVYRQITDNIHFLNYYWGTLSAPLMPAIGNENLMKSMPELVDLVRLGWQPSPGVDCPDTILAARYGIGAGSRIAIINPDFRDQEFTLAFPLQYWNNKAVLIAYEDGSELISDIAAEGTKANIKIPKRSIMMIRVVGTGKVPKKKFESTGTKVMVNGKAPYWRFVLKTVGENQWNLEFARSESDISVRIKCYEDNRRYKADEPLNYIIDSSSWPEDLQAANLNSAQLEIREYFKYSVDELENDILKEMKFAQRPVVIKYDAKASETVRNEAERICEWFRFYTDAAEGKYREPLINGPMPENSIIITLETGRGELSAHQNGRAFMDGNVIRICAANDNEVKKLVLEVLNRFDQAYPFYGALPDNKEFQKYGLAGKTIQNAPHKKIFRPTLLEMMRKNGIRK